MPLFLGVSHECYLTTSLHPLPSPIAGRVLFAWIQIENFALRFEQRVLELAAPFGIGADACHRIAGFDHGPSLEDVNCRVEENAGDLLWVELAKMALQIMKTDIRKSAGVHDHVAIRIRNVEE